MNIHFLRLILHKMYIFMNIHDTYPTWRTAGGLSPVWIKIRARGAFCTGYFCCEWRKISCGLFANKNITEYQGYFAASGNAPSHAGSLREPLCVTAVWWMRNEYANMGTGLPHHGKVCTAGCFFARKKSLSKYNNFSKTPSFFFGLPCSWTFRIILL